MKFRSIKNSFLAGQISPTVWGRTDLPQYQHACRLLKNMIPKKSGGAYRRPGSLSAAIFPITGFTQPRILPFIVSRQQPYAVVISNAVSAGVVGNCQYSAYRPVGDNSNNNVLNASVTGTPPYKIASFASAGVAASNAFQNGLGVDDDIQQIQHCQSADVMWLTHPLYKPQKLLLTALDTFKWVPFDYDSVAATPLASHALLQAYPYLNQNTDGITLQPSAVTGAGVTLTASGLINGVGFQAGHVGAIFVIDQGSSGATNHIGAIQITSITDTTHAVGKVIVDFNTAAAAYATWWESAWSDYRGWPKSCCIFQQRLVMGGTAHQPDTSWMSQTANYGVFSMLGSTIPAGVAPAGVVVPATYTVSPAGGAYRAPVDDSPGDGQTTGPSGSNPFRITLSQNTVDQIQWYSPDAQFLIGTQNQEWLIAPQNGDFSVGNYTALVQSKYGSDNVPAVRIGYELMFVMGSGDEVRAYQYNFVDSSFFAEPVQLLFDEYPKALPSAAIAGRRKVKYMSWDVSRDCLWVNDMAGNFYGLTRDRKLAVTAWHTHQMGGFNAAQGLSTIGTVGAGTLTMDAAYYTCDGSVISHEVIPNPFSQMNDVWLIVKRTLNSIVYWQLERMIGRTTTRNSAFEATFPGYVPGEPLLVDSAWCSSIDGTTQTFAAAAAQLPGVDMTGAYYNSKSGIFKVTTSGATINNSVPGNYALADGSQAVMTLGFPFTPIVQPVTVEAGSQIGTAQGAIHVISRVLLRVYRTLTAYVGVNPDSEDPNPPEKTIFRDYTAALGHSPEIFTGLKQIYPPSTYSRDDTLYITADDPLPFELSSVIVEAEEYDQS